MNFQDMEIPQLLEATCSQQFNPDVHWPPLYNAHAQLQRNPACFQLKCKFALVLYTISILLSF